MSILLVVFVLFVLLDIAATRWGYDSRYGINDAEWTRRWDWQIARLAYRD